MGNNAFHFDSSLFRRWGITRTADGTRGKTGRRNAAFTRVLPRDLPSHTSWEQGFNPKSRRHTRVTVAFKGYVKEYVKNHLLGLTHFKNIFTVTTLPPHRVGPGVREPTRPVWPQTG
ncbi:hypothetical protein AVEN_195886-1 [Araneus ventricosus]|uniref:Uncharacterized protein n=1 Tax=Araneus ventricosus TaxID=182803 RepID=A0A4Y2DXG9_ARAVE|nr:hypothetical protein AVEN_195886-1 [Araneus ventricosus]